MRDARTIQETLQAVTAIVEAFHVWHKASADERVTWAEWAGFIRLIPQVWDAVSHAADIPRELADLDGLEADELLAMVASVINVQIETREMQVKVDKILIAFHAIADAVAQWRGVNPPRAEVVS